MSFLKRIFFRKDDCEKEYQILDSIGSGSFAQVKRAKRKDDGSEWAIKIIDKTKLSAEDAEGLQAEVDILELLSHPHIVQMRQIFDCKKSLYIVMELMTGGELFDRIVEEEKFSEERARVEVAKIAKALKYCHDNGIVHRDLKPENLLYSEPGLRGELKIADFGLAKLLKETDMMATACGTPGYVAPEILCGYAYTDKVDVWSLGVVVYIMLCGFPPFYDENNAVLFQMIQQAEFDFPAPYWDDVSDSAKDFITKMLVPNPEDRMSCEDVLNHPWISRNQSDNPLTVMQKEMGKFQVRRKFKMAVLKARVVDGFRTKQQKNASAISEDTNPEEGAAAASSPSSSKTSTTASSKPTTSASAQSPTK